MAAPIVQGISPLVQPLDLSSTEQRQEVCPENDVLLHTGQSMVHSSSVSHRHGFSREAENVQSSSHSESCLLTTRNDFSNHNDGLVYRTSSNENNCSKLLESSHHNRNHESMSQYLTSLFGCPAAPQSRPSELLDNTCLVRFGSFFENDLDQLHPHNRGETSASLDPRSTILLESLSATNQMGFNKTSSGVSMGLGLELPLPPLPPQRLSSESADSNFNYDISTSREQVRNIGALDSPQQQSSLIATGMRVADEFLSDPQRMGSTGNQTGSINNTGNVSPLGDSLHSFFFSDQLTVESATTPSVATTTVIDNSHPHLTSSLDSFTLLNPHHDHYYNIPPLDNQSGLLQEHMQQLPNAGFDARQQLANFLSNSGILSNASSSPSQPSHTTVTGYDTIPQQTQQHIQDRASATTRPMTPNTNASPARIIQSTRAADDNSIVDVYRSRTAFSQSDNTNQSSKAGNLGTNESSFRSRFSNEIHEETARTNGAENSGGRGSTIAQQFSTNTFLQEQESGHHVKNDTVSQEATTAAQLAINIEPPSQNCTSSSPHSGSNESVNYTSKLGNSQGAVNRVSSTAAEANRTNRTNGATLSCERGVSDGSSHSGASTSATPLSTMSMSSQTQPSLSVPRPPRPRRPTHGSTSVLGALLQRLFALHNSAPDVPVSALSKTQRKADAIAYAVSQLSTNELLQLLKNVITFQNARKPDSHQKQNGTKDWQNSITTENLSRRQNNINNHSLSRLPDNESAARIFANDNLDTVTDELSLISGISDRRFLRAVAQWCQQQSPLKNPASVPSSTANSPKLTILPPHNDLSIPHLALDPTIPSHSKTGTLRSPNSHVIGTPPEYKSVFRQLPFLTPSTSLLHSSFTSTQQSPSIKSDAVHSIPTPAVVTSVPPQLTNIRIAMASDNYSSSDVSKSFLSKIPEDFSFFAAPPPFFPSRAAVQGLFPLTTAISTILTKVDTLQQAIKAQAELQANALSALLNTQIEIGLMRQTEKCGCDLKTEASTSTTSTSTVKCHDTPSNSLELGKCIIEDQELKGKRSSLSSSDSVKTNQVMTASTSTSSSTSAVYLNLSCSSVKEGVSDNDKENPENHQFMNDVNNASKTREGLESKESQTTPSSVRKKRQRAVDDVMDGSGLSTDRSSNDENVTPPRKEMKIENPYVAGSDDTYASPNFSHMVGERKNISASSSSSSLPNSSSPLFDFNHSLIHLSSLSCFGTSSPSLPKSNSSSTQNAISSSSSSNVLPLSLHDQAVEEPWQQLSQNGEAERLPLKETNGSSTSQDSFHSDGFQEKTRLKDKVASNSGTDCSSSVKDGNLSSTKQCLLQLEALAAATPRWAQHGDSYKWHCQRLQNRRRNLSGDTIFANQGNDIFTKSHQSVIDQATVRENDKVQVQPHYSSASSSENHLSGSSMADDVTEKYLHLFLNDFEGTEPSLNSGVMLDGTAHPVDLVSRQAIQFLSPHDYITGKMKESWEVTAPHLPELCENAKDVLQSPSNINQISLRLQQAVELIPLWISRLDAYRLANDPMFMPLTALSPHLQTTIFFQFLSTYVNASRHQLLMLESELLKCIQLGTTAEDQLLAQNIIHQNQQQLGSLWTPSSTPCDSLSHGASQRQFDQVSTENSLQSGNFETSKMYPNNAAEAHNGHSLEHRFAFECHRNKGNDQSAPSTSSSESLAKTVALSQMNVTSHSERSEPKKSSSLHVRSTNPERINSPTSSTNGRKMMLMVCTAKPTAAVSPSTVTSAVARSSEEDEPASASLSSSTPSVGNGSNLGTDSESTSHSCKNSSTDWKPSTPFDADNPTAELQSIRDSKLTSMLVDSKLENRQKPKNHSNSNESTSDLQTLLQRAVAFSNPHTDEQPASGTSTTVLSLSGLPNSMVSGRQGTLSCNQVGPSPSLSTFRNSSTVSLQTNQVTAPTVPAFHGERGKSGGSSSPSRSTTRSSSSNQTTCQRGGRGGGIQGVVWKPEEETWVAFWQDPTTSQQQVRRFPIAQFGAETARKMAMKCRREADKQLTAAVMVNRFSNSSGNSRDSNLGAPQLPRSEVPGVYWYRNRNGWVAQWFENGKNKHKFFAASVFGVEGAKQKAIAYRLMKLEEKKLRGW